VKEGETYEITIEYFHGIGEAVLNFKILRRLNISESFDVIAEKVDRADVIVFVGGITPSLEGEEMPVKVEGFDGGDRTFIELPRVQRDFLENLKSLGKPIVLVVCAGSAIAFNNSGIAAALDAFYPGEAGGIAVADVLYGRYNPGGRLPLTFYTGTSELDDFSDYNMSAAEKGRTYRYSKGKPLYPFGHGLSYTQFAYDNLEVKGDPVRGEKVEVSFRVRNVGDRAGDEVPQIYVSAIGVAKEPIKSLRWFKRQTIGKNEDVKVTTVLGSDAFEVFNEATQKLELAPGVFRIAVGGSSADEVLITKDVTFSVPDPRTSVPNVETTTPASGESSKFPGWAIGVIVGGVILIIVGIVIFLLRKRRIRKYRVSPLTISIWRIARMCDPYIIPHDHETIPMHFAEIETLESTLPRFCIDFFHRK
jgi:beta-glucosidase